MERILPILLLITLVVSGCGRAAVEPTATAELPHTPPAVQTPSPTPFGPAVITATSIPESAGLDVPLAGPTPGLPPGEDWPVYEDTALGLAFSYPPGWTETAPGRLEGQGGWVQVETRPSDGAGSGAVCQGEANRRRPARYGAAPLIVAYRDPSRPEGCVVLSSGDQPAARRGESIFLGWDAPELPEGRLLVLRASREAIFPIVESLHWLPGDATPEPEIACLPFDNESQPETTTAAGLRVDAFPIAASAGEVKMPGNPDGPAPCSPFADPTALSQKTSVGLLAAQAEAVIATQWSVARLEALNQGLAPFGYAVGLADRLFTVTRDNVVVGSRFSWLGQLSVNASGTDFTLPVVDSYNSQTYLLTPDGLHESEGWDILAHDRVFPVFAGDDRVQVVYNYSRYDRPISDPALLDITINGALLDTLSVRPSTLSGGPARGLWAWDGHWALDLSGLVIQDGRLLNDRLAATEVSGFRLVAGRPFFFYRKEGLVRLSYDGQTLPIAFDDVILEAPTLAGTLLQMQGYPGGVLFYARSGSTWYFVTILAGV